MEPLKNMIAYIFIAFIAIQNVAHGSDMPFCPQPKEWQSPGRDLGREPQPNHHRWPIYYEPRPETVDNQCGETCLGPPPKVSSVVYSPIALKKILENVELKCDPKPGNRIEKIIIKNNQLQYNATCNGVIAGVEQNPGIIYDAIITSKDKEEAIVPLIASAYRYVATYNMGTETFTENTKLKNSICNGAELSSYSVWVADDPTQGCCSGGVRISRAVYYKLEIRGGNCCTVCRLLAASHVYESPLRN